METTNCGLRPTSRPRSVWYRADDVYAPAGSGAGTLRLNANEGRPLPAALKAINEALTDGNKAGDELCRYEAPSELEEAIAARWGVAADRVVVCAGADDALDRVCSTRLAPGAKALRFDPDFEMFARRAKGKGAELVSLPWLSDGFPLRQALELVERCPSLSLVYLASPNNPTGLCASTDNILALADACERSGCALIFDAAYAEFASSDPSKELVDRCAAFILRTFSKAYGLAGLRVGYAIAPNAEEARLLRAAGSPYPVTNLAQRAAVASLKDEEGLAKAMEFARAARTRMSELLASLGLSVVPSEANFALVRCGSAQSAMRLRDRLALEGIAIRSYADSGALASCLRVSCPTDEDGLTRLELALSGVSP